MIDNYELEKLRSVAVGELKAVTLPMLFNVADGEEGLKNALEQLMVDAASAVRDGASILILSDRGVDAEKAPIPALLATSAVHHHLIREGTRTQCGLVIETGEARESHHFCLLVGYGAGAINPYLAFETLADLDRDGLLPEGINFGKAKKNYIKAANKAILKVASKMGISTVQSYRGAQIFEAIGLADEVIERYFTKTPSRIKGIDLDVIARESLERHRRGFPPIQVNGEVLETGGFYQWRRDGEWHMWNPETVGKMQAAVRADLDAAQKLSSGMRVDSYKTFKEYTSLVNSEAQRRCTLRGLLQFKKGLRAAVPIEEVEPAQEIVKRFCTGAMSLGSISTEAHENLAIAMNRIGGKSNTGEGGEDPRRFVADAKPDAKGRTILRRSAIKQVASGDSA